MTPKTAQETLVLPYDAIIYRNFTRTKLQEV